MVEESSNNGSSEGEDEADREQQPSIERHGRYDRSITDSSISDWLRSKEEKRPKRIFSSLTKRTRLNPVSKKQKKKNSDYAKAKEEHYKNDENRRCFFCGTTRYLSVHHTEKRTDGKISDQKTFLTLCLLGDYLDRQNEDMNHSHSGGCHGFVEGNKQWARDNGYLI